MDSISPPPEGWVAIALLGRAWGRRGELAAVPLNKNFERYRQIQRVFLFDAEGARGADEPMDVESVWEHRGQVVFKFRGVDSISDAERLQGAEVRVPAAERPELPKGEFYQSDLIGCDVVDCRTGDLIGRVAGWQECGGPDLLQVEGSREGEEILIPFARAICVEIDVIKRRIAVDLPEGLRDLSS